MSGIFGQEFFILAGLFITVVLLTSGVFAMIASRDGVSRRMAKLAHGVADPSQPTLQFSRKMPGLSRFLRPIDKKVGPKNAEVRSTARKKLIRAGIYSPTATEFYFASRIALAVALPFFLMFIVPILFGNPSPNIILLIIFGGAVFGFYAPFIYVHARVQQRQKAVRNGLPDSLDLLLVCVEAGASLSGAFHRVGDELELIHPVVSEQFKLISLELQAGVGRAESLRNFADRTDVEEVHSLTTLLIQSETLGTSLARALRVHAEEMRNQRMLKAEERANKLPVKLALPLVLFILPCLMLVIMTPLIIRIFRVILTTGA